MRTIGILALSASLLLPTGTVLAQTTSTPQAPFALTDARLQELLAQCKIANCAASAHQTLTQAQAAGLKGLELDVKIALPLVIALAEAAIANPSLAAQASAGLEATAARAHGAGFAEVVKKTATQLNTGSMNAIDIPAIRASVLGPKAGGTRARAGSGGG